MNETAYSQDRWWQARLKTAQYKGEWPERLYTWITYSLPGRPTKRVPVALISLGRGIGVDLNKYRRGVNVQMLYDLGVRIFDLRLFGPKVWTYGLWGYEQDISFEEYYWKLVELPGVIIGAYGVYNPWLDEESNYTSLLDPNVEYMKLYSKNYPGIAYYTWDVEVGTCVKGSNLNNGITPVNLVKGLSRTMYQTLHEMPAFTENKLPRIPELYSATWFLKQYGENMKVWLEQSTKDANNPLFVQWLAWLPMIFSEMFDRPQQLYDKLITPNGLQENAYLRIGAAELAGKWQSSFTLKGAWSEVGVDTSITYGLFAMIERYRYLHNIPSVVVPPPDEPPSPPGGDTSYVTVARYEADRAADRERIERIKAQL